MLDNPDELGIYPTTICFAELDDLFDDILVTHGLQPYEPSEAQILRRRGEMKNDPDFKVKKGTLIKRDYKEAWSLFWAETDKETKQKFLNLPNFDQTIFEKITGIKANEDNGSCEGKVVEIDGKKYKLSEVK